MFFNEFSTKNLNFQMAIDSIDVYQYHWSLIQKNQMQKCNICDYNFLGGVVCFYHVINANESM
jgi:hypothetical protein